MEAQKKVSLGTFLDHFIFYILGGARGKDNFREGRAHQVRRGRDLAAEGRHLQPEGRVQEVFDVWQILGHHLSRGLEEGTGGGCPEEQDKGASKHPGSAQAGGG